MTPVLRFLTANMRGRNSITTLFYFHSLSYSRKQNWFAAILLQHLKHLWVKDFSGQQIIFIPRFSFSSTVKGPALQQELYAHQTPPTMISFQNIL